MSMPRKAFTLLEVMLSLAILALVAGGIFTMISAAMQVTHETEQRQERARKSEALGEYVRGEFARLPRGARLFLRSSDQGSPVQELLVENAPGAFASGSRPGHLGPSGIALDAGPDGLLNLRIVELSQSAFVNRSITRSLKLAGGLRSLRWSVKIGGGEWLDSWSGLQLPELVRMTWQVQGDMWTKERIFEIPGSKLFPVEERNEKK